MGSYDLFDMYRFIFKDCIACVQKHRDISLDAFYTLLDAWEILEKE